MFLKKNQLYFSKKPAKIHLVDMYHFLVKIMNRSNLKHCFLKEPHTIIVLLKSMELIVNEEKITDDHPLLWDTGTLRKSVEQFER